MSILTAVLTEFLGGLATAAAIALANRVRQRRRKLRGRPPRSSRP
ncbi:hypothetical protein ACIPD2_08280 [Streptomyces griseofuscus]|nr:hypothetical protein [Streptomyces sp. CRPSP2-6A1]